MAINSIRNIGFFGHAGSGKTTIADAFLYLTGANNRFGKVSDKTSVFDFGPEEMDRGFSLNVGIATLTYQDSMISLVDTPGYSDFIGEALSGVEAVDCGVIVIDATGGIEVGTEMLLKQLEKKSLPIVFFINKLKKEHADFYKIFNQLRDITKKNVIPLTIPIGEALKFSAVVDIIKNKAFGPEGKELELPADIKEKAKPYQENLIEAAADVDENLMNKYLEGAKIEPSEYLQALKRGIAESKIAVCLAGDALDLIGVKNLIDVVMEYLPPANMLPDIEIGEQKIKRADDVPFLGYVFKTVVEPHLGELCYLRVLSGKVQPGDIVKNLSQASDEKINQMFLIKGKEKSEINQFTSGMIGGLVKLKDTHTGNTLSTGKIATPLPSIEFPAPSISMAIVPKAKGDEEKVSTGLARLRDEDPTFSFSFDPEIKQLIISGIGELHLDVILSRLKRKYGVSVDLAKPKIKYRETFKKKSEAQGKYKKQTGGHGQYGDCWIRVEPLGRGEGVKFEDEVVGGAIPSRFIPSIEKGVTESVQHGFLAGYPLADTKVTVFDGSYHDVDSSDIAFKIAASMALRANAEQGNVVLLEPISDVEVSVPENFMGDVIGDLNSRRGKIMGMEGFGKIQRIKALVPEAEMYKYSTSLRSMTQGRGYFNMKFHHYEEVPKEITQRIVAEAKKEAK